MKLYLDQMFHLELVERVRAQGHDVVHASDVEQSRADDAEILERAGRDRRILITLDKHFGDWVVLPLSRHRGVIRLRVRPATNDNIAAVLVPFLARHEGEDFRNCLVIVSANQERWIKSADVPTDGES